MKTKLKKWLSVLVAIATLCSCIVVPASAATETVSLGFANGGWNAKNFYVVDIVFTGDDGDFDMYSGEINVEFDKSILALANVVTTGKIADVQVENEFTGEMESFSIGASSTPVATANSQGYVTIAWADTNSYNHKVTSGQTVAQLFFKVADSTLESCTTNLDFKVEGRSNVIGYYTDSNQNYTINDSAVQAVAIAGVAPTLSTVALSKTEAKADGVNADTLTASAASAKGTNITNSVAWSVAPTGKGVTVVADGTVTVDAKAEAGEYTVTATADGTNVLGTTASKTFTVTRNASVLTSLTLDKSAVTVDGKNDQTVTATLKDQYGSDMTAAITVSPSDDVTVSGKTITVAKDAAEGTYTVSADGKNATFTVTRAGAGVVVDFTASAIDNDPMLIPIGTGAAGKQLLVSNAVDAYGDPVATPEVTYSLKEAVAGITVEGGVLTVKNPAATVIGKSEEKTVTVIAEIDGVKKEIPVTVKRAASEATSVVIMSDGAAVADSIAVGIPTASKVFAVEVLDQYGTKMDVAATLTLESAAAGITLDGTTLKVADTTADGATATLKASYNGKTDSVAIEAKTVSVDWTGVVASGITYGKTKADAITLPSGTGAATGYIDGVETAMDGTFEVVDAAAVPAAGSVDVTVKFTITSDGIYKDTEFTKTYNVAVAQKALTLTDGDVVVTKEYNGNTNAGALTGALALTGVVGSDDVSVNMTGVTVGAYPSADYGTHTVTLSGIALTGAAAGNYTVASTYDFAGATITKTVLKASDFTVAATTEATYDGTAKTVTVTPNVTGAGAITVLYNGEASAVNAGEYAITINVAEGTNYAAATGLDLSAELVIAKAERTITPDAATIVLVGETPVDVKITTDAEAEVSVSTSVDEVIVLESYSENVATFTALNDDVTTVTFAAPESDNYLAGSATVKAISVAKPIDGRSVSGAFNIDCDYSKIGQITLTAESVNPELVEIEFSTPDMGDDATITLNPSNPIPLATTELTVTVEAAGQTIVVPYTVSISIKKVAAKVNLTADEFGIVDVLPDEVYDDIYDAAEEAGVDEVNVSVSTEVEVEDGKVTITPTYTVTDTETGDPLIVDGAIESTTDPVVVEVELEDVADDTKLMVKDADGEYEIVTVADRKIAIETADFTKTFKIVEPATITINYTYNKVKEDGSTPASVEYDIDDVGTALPTDEKSGNTFKGWTINGKVYTTLTVDLLDTDDGTEYDATASFKKKSSGGGIAYVISVEDADNGTVKASKKTAGKGETVTVTVKPDKGYELDELTVTDKDGDELKLKSKGDGKYTFTMPKGKVYVEATFEAVEVEVEVSFSDVAESDSYFDAVEWAVAEGITTGYANGTFLPGNTVTRAQAVTFLWRAMGEPEPETTEMPFVDVPVGSYYYDAVLWAVENGITTGMTETTFVPDRTISRAQTITFLWRTAKMEGYDVSVGAETNILSYADAMTIGEYAIPAMQWACGEQIVDSYADGTLRPNEGCSRAQTVTFLYRFLG